MDRPKRRERRNSLPKEVRFGDSFEDWDKIETVAEYETEKKKEKKEGFLNQIGTVAQVYANKAGEMVNSMAGEARRRSLKPRREFDSDKDIKIITTDTSGNELLLRKKRSQSEALLEAASALKIDENRKDKLPLEDKNQIDFCARDHENKEDCKAKKKLLDKEIAIIDEHIRKNRKPDVLENDWRKLKKSVDEHSKLMQDIIDLTEEGFINSELQGRINRKNHIEDLAKSYRKKISAYQNTYGDFSHSESEACSRSEDEVNEEHQEIPSKPMKKVRNSRKKASKLVKREWCESESSSGSEDEFEEERKKLPKPGRSLMRIPLQTLKSTSSSSQFMVWWNSFYVNVHLTNLTYHEKLSYLLGALDEKLKERYSHVNMIANPNVFLSMKEQQRQNRSTYNKLIEELQNEYFSMENYSLELKNKMKRINPKGNYVEALREISALIATMSTYELAGASYDQENSLFISEFLSKMKHNDQINFKLFLANNSKPNTLKSLKEFVDQLKNALKSVASIEASAFQECEKSSRSKPKNSYAAKMSKEKKFPKTDKKNCAVCEKGPHPVYKCYKFKGLSPEDRKKKAAELKLCFLCLRPGHYAENCDFQDCSKCSNQHNTLLHQDPEVEHESKKAIQHQSPKASYTVSSSVSRNQQTWSALTIEGYAGEDLVPVRQFFDPGSDCSFYSPEFEKKVNFPRRKIICDIKTCNGTEYNQVTHEMKIPLYNSKRQFLGEIKAIKRKDLPTEPKLDQQKLTKIYPHLKGIHVPKCGAGLNVDLLIGRDAGDLINPLKIKAGKRHEPRAYLYPSGWMITAPNANFKRSALPLQVYDVQVQKRTDLDLNESMKILLDQDHAGLKHEEKLDLAQNEKKVIKIFEESVKTNQNDQLMIKVPFNNKKEDFENNYHQALKRLPGLINSLEKKGMTKEYQEIMEKQEDSGYMQEIKDPNPDVGKKAYIAHFPVINPNSKTTRVRSVLDTGISDRNGLKFNATIDAGPNLNPDIVEILMGFRQGTYVWTGDLKKMFFNVAMYPEDKEMHRILWKKPGEKEVRIYRWNSHIFGSPSSPAVAAYACIYQAKTHEDKMPDGASTIMQAKYVDDFAYSCDDLEQAKKSLKEAKSILGEISMELHKVSSNNLEILQSVPVDDRVDSWNTGPIPTARVLGLQFNPNDDSLKIVLPPSKAVKTRRGFLCQMAGIFDPLGLISPFLVQARLYLQESWQSVDGWDTNLPPELQSKVDSWTERCQVLSNLSFPRKPFKGKLEKLHMFCDSSEYAYGLALYGQGVDQQGLIDSGLIMGKSRVHGLKEMSIPRKELKAAVLCARVAAVVSEIWPSIPLQLYSDSQNVLGWLNNQTKRNKQFVANRISLILELTKENQWQYIDTSRNPADIPSRGADLEELSSNNLWLKGPDFINDLEAKPPDQPTFSLPDSELKKDQIREMIISSYYVRANWIPVIEQFDNLKDLVKTMAQVTKERNNEDPNDLSAEDLEQALIELIKVAQQESYEEEFEDLKSQGKVKIKSKIVKLTPQLDEEDVIRLRTRLEFAEGVPEETKNPILLPKKHHLTNLMIKEIHNETNHAYGTNYTLHALRKKYWLPAGRQIIKSILGKCRECKLKFGKPQRPQMAPLPKMRIDAKDLKAFLHTGCDFAGPFLCKVGRFRAKVKRYLCLFTCMKTRAVHLEMCESLETNDFLQALGRFCARRGRIKTLTCDNALNFKGSEAELRRLIQAMDAAEIQAYAENTGFSFQYTPPNSPHMGGVWESMIKSAKRAIRATLSKADFTDWQLMTAIVRAEDLLNSRPLGYVNSNPNDFEVLTPAMFLHGRLDGQVFPESVDNTPFNNLSPQKRWRVIEASLKKIWNRWMRELLPSLGPREKWFSDQRSYQIGDEILVVDKNQPRYKWKIGRITQVHPGRDGVVRVVTYNTEEERQLKISVHKTFPLT